MERRGFYFEMVERQWRAFTSGTQAEPAAEESDVSF
jgi:hypothetical protein